MLTGNWYKGLIGGLEPRLMYDGAAVATAAATLTQSDGGDAAVDGSAGADAVDTGVDSSVDTVVEAGSVTEALLDASGATETTTQSTASTTDESVSSSDDSSEDLSESDSGETESDTESSQTVEAAADESTDTSEAVAAVTSTDSAASSDTAAGVEGVTLDEAVPVITTEEVAFVDAGLENYQDLVDEITSDSSMDVIVVAEDVDGYAYMAEVLSTSSDLSAIHVIGHGETGSATLGTATLDVDNVDEYSDVFAVIGSSLSENGDILLYGCDVGDRGRVSYSPQNIHSGYGEP